MSVKTILVCLTTKKHASTLLKAAVPLARRFNAHLVGLHTLEALEFYPGIAMHVPAATFSDFNDHQMAEGKKIEALFRKHTAKENFVAEYRLLKAQSQTASDRMVECARAADIVIMAQEDRDSDRIDQRHVQADVIKQSGRPVIIVPLDYDGPAIGKRAIIGWSETREAARAAHDLKELLEPGAKIWAVRVEKTGTEELEDSSLLDVTKALTRHGFQVQLSHASNSEKSNAEILMSFAAEKGADIVATGAFGHSRFYDLVIGATSRELLRSSEMPTLFSK